MHHAYGPLVWLKWPCQQKEGMSCLRAKCGLRGWTCIPPWGAGRTQPALLQSLTPTLRKYQEVPPLAPQCLAGVEGHSNTDAWHNTARLVGSQGRPAETVTQEGEPAVFLGTGMGSSRVAVNSQDYNFRIL